MSRINPDLVKKLQRYVASGNEMFGQAVTLRKFIGISAGHPEFGVADLPLYQNRPTTMELRQLTLEESQMVGGQDVRGGYEVISLDPLTMRDEVLYEGEVYRIVSYPAKEVIGESIYWRAYIERASITGLY